MSTVSVSGGVSTMSMGFSITFLFMAVIAIMTIGAFVAIIVIGLRRRSKNNDSPVITATAKLVAKRTQVSGSSTWYYATFEMEGGTRVEFYVDGTEYGLLVEGDTGKLEFQGTRYKSFRRENQ